jgi:hypothetical protein
LDFGLSQGYLKVPEPEKASHSLLQWENPNPRKRGMTPDGL